MSEIEGNEHEVSFEKLLHELQRELEYQSNGGTSYRKKTVELSIELANIVADVTPFYKLDSSKETVANYLGNLDRYRIEDIAKMLYVIARDLHRRANMSADIKQYIQQKRKNQPLSLVKRKKEVKENDN